VVLGRAEFETARVVDLGCRARYNDPDYRMRGYTSKTVAMQLVKYGEAELGGHHVVNNPFVRGFQQDGANFTARQLQVSRLTDERK
jgi:hypothetical protein